jgi:hypothetical protein
MTLKLSAALALALALIFLSATAGAHHNMSALFDFNNRVTLTGTLSKVDWRNPHIQLIVDGKNADGKNGEQVDTWAIEGPSQLLPHPRHHQGRFRRSRRQDPHRRSQPRPRRLPRRTPAHSHPARRQSSLRLPAELLGSTGFSL